jgi:hypothetical protein
MNAAFKYFPFVCILVTLINAAVFRARARRLTAGNGESLHEYDAVIRAFVLYVSGWFLAQGIGVVAGLVSAFTVPPAQGTGIRAYDWFLFSLALLINLRFASWVYLENGAEVLARCRGMFDRFPESPRAIRLWVSVIMVVSLAGSANVLWQASNNRG